MTRALLGGVCLLAMLACNSITPTGAINGTIGNRNVTIKDTAFTPVQVRPDSLGHVVWTWSDGGVTHNVTFEDSIPGSGDQTTGTFTQTFLTPGVYRFRCTHHSTAFGSGMHGAVIVGVTAPPDTTTGGGYGY